MGDPEAARCQHLRDKIKMVEGWAESWELQAWHGERTAAPKANIEMARKKAQNIRQDIKEWKQELAACSHSSLAVPYVEHVNHVSFDTMSSVDFLGPIVLAALVSLR
ncbi:MAG: hypothetical protein GDA40_06415 [Rhodobacteraceae bacterium]|nr:hypothetical protein [Paracoccaceae bacterium]